MLRSCDGVIFKFYRKNLECFSEVFGDAQGISLSCPVEGEIVDLPETSDVLDLLLQFMSRQPQPDLTSLDFPLLAALAEAAEKYLLYAALTLCRRNMEWVGISVKHWQ
jgi:hypothetical protein